VTVLRNAAHARSVLRRREVLELVGDVGVGGDVVGVLLVRFELAGAGEAGTLGELFLLARREGRGVEGDDNLSAEATEEGD
jgi:hypothetical protein